MKIFYKKKISLRIIRSRCTKFHIRNNLLEIYSNSITACKKFLPEPETVTSAERSSSKLKIIKITCDLAFTE